MNDSKTSAYLIRAGRVVAIADTAAKSGDVVSYGFTVLDDCIHEVGKAKVSRAKKWDRYEPINEDRAFVNYGGGAPV